MLSFFLFLAWDLLKFGVSEWAGMDDPKHVACKSKTRSVNKSRIDPFLYKLKWLLVGQP